MTVTMCENRRSTANRWLSARFLPTSSSPTNDGRQFHATFNDMRLLNGRNLLLNWFFWDFVRLSLVRFGEVTGV
jgi:hypothetical protein